MDIDKVVFRFATEDDVDDILAVYAQYIDTSITFEYVLPSHEEFSKRVRDIISFYPYIVALYDGQIIGYAYSHRAFERIAYQWDVEASIYIARDFCGHGIGKKLYRRLIELSKLQNIHIIYAKVTRPNDSSEALHTAMGFKLISEFEKCGYKNGEWLGIVWYERRLCESEAEPKPLHSVHALPEDKVCAIMNSPY